MRKRRGDEESLFTDWNKGSNSCSPLFFSLSICLSLTYQAGHGHRELKLDGREEGGDRRARFSHFCCYFSGVFLFFSLRERGSEVGKVHIFFTLSLPPFKKQKGKCGLRFLFHRRRLSRSGRGSAMRECRAKGKKRERHRERDCSRCDLFFQWTLKPSLGRRVSFPLKP